MKVQRRRFLHLAAGAAALPAVSGFTWAQSYPSRPVHLIVGFPAGTATDIVARLMGQSLSERLGQQFVIENRPGAGSNIGAEAVVKAPPDGYTLLEVSSANAMNATLFDNLGFNFIRDIAPVAGIGRAPFVVVVTPSFPPRTVPELIAYAKANPGSVNMASIGNGTAQHVAGELFKSMAGVDMLHVPYRGSPMPDLLGGQVQIMFNPISASIEYIRAGTLRALAVTGATRSELLPDIPIVAEFVPGYEASGLQGIGAPRRTPVDVIERLNREINAITADPKMKSRLAGLGYAVLSGSPADFGKFIAEETEKWGRVIRTANIKAEQ